MEGSDATFATADFTAKFSGTLASVKIVTLPSSGSLILKVNGTETAVTASQEITAANLGNLLFRAGTNTYGAWTIVVQMKGADGQTTAANNNVVVEVPNTPSGIQVDSTKIPTGSKLAEDATVTSMDIPIEGICRNPDNLTNSTAIDQQNTTSDTGGLILRVISGSSLFTSHDIVYNSATGKYVLRASTPKAIGTGTTTIGCRAGNKAEVTFDVTEEVTAKTTTLNTIADQAKGVETGSGLTY